MGMFDAINTADTGVGVSQTWMDAISNNLANMNDVTSTSKSAYQAEFVDATSLNATVTGAGPGGPGAGVGAGAGVTGLTLSSAQGVVEQDPSSPLADANGNVRVPNVDMAQQMTDLIMAQRGYEANLNTISAAAQAYQAALGLKL